MSKEEERTPDSILIAIGELEKSIAEAEASETSYSSRHLKQDLAKFELYVQELRSVRGHRRSIEDMQARFDERDARRLEAHLDEARDAKEYRRHMLEQAREQRRALEKIAESIHAMNW